MEWIASNIEVAMCDITRGLKMVSAFIGSNAVYPDVLFRSIAGVVFGHVPLHSLPALVRRQGHG